MAALNPIDAITAHPRMFMLRHLLGKNYIYLILKKLETNLYV